MFPPFFHCRNRQDIQHYFRIFQHFRTPPQSLLHAPYRVPIALVLQIAVSVILIIVKNAAPGLVATERFGTPEKRLKTIILMLVLGVGTSRHRIEARVLTPDGEIGIPHLGGSLHHLARQAVTTQTVEQEVPVRVVRQPPTLGTDAAHRTGHRLAMTLMRRQVHRRRPIVENAVPRIQRRGVIGGILGLRGGEIGIAVPSLTRRGGRTAHILGHPALRPDLHCAIDIPLVVLRDRRRRAERITLRPLLRLQGERGTHYTNHQ